MATPVTSRPQADPTPQVVAYLRRSTDRQEQSLDDQRQALETYAEREGFEVTQWFVDDAISGTSVQGRKGFQAMVQAAQAPSRTFQHVLVYDVKRFGRTDTDEAGYYRFLLRQAGVEVIYTSEGFIGDDSDDLIRSVKQWQARNESKDLSKVTIRGQVSHTENGFWCGGTPPLGYDLRYSDSSGKPYQVVRWLANGDKEVYDAAGTFLRRLQRGERLTSSKKDRVRLVPSTPERVALVKRIFHESIDEGKGYRTIANQMNEDGIPSPRDGNWSKNTRSRWSVGSIRAILRNPAYSGDSVWNRRTFAKFHRIKGGVAVPRPRQDADKPRENREADWVVVRNTHQAIIPRTTFERLQELLRQRGRNAGVSNYRSGSGARSPYLLTGLLVCARCGHRYQGRAVNSTKKRKDGSKIRTLYYACGGYVMKGAATCEKFLLNKEPIENAVSELVSALLRGDTNKLLRDHAADTAAERARACHEASRLRSQVAQVERQASLLMDDLTDDTREFVNSKLRDLGTEKRRLQQRLQETEPLIPAETDLPIESRHALSRVRVLQRRATEAGLPARKALLHDLIARVEVFPGDSALTVWIRSVPASVADLGATPHKIPLTGTRSFAPTGAKVG